MPDENAQSSATQVDRMVDFDGTVQDQCAIIPSQTVDALVLVGPTPPVVIMAVLAVGLR